MPRSACKIASTSVPRHLNIFISSPGDVQIERNIVDTVLTSLPRTPAWRNKFTISTWRWDDPMAPTPMSALQTPQQSVDNTLLNPEDCDLTIVILWSRLGTFVEGHTKNDGTLFTGTELEFERARRAKREILIYRCTKKPSIEIDDPELESKRAQYLRVRSFFDQLSNNGGVPLSGYQEYKDPDQFRTLLQANLEVLLRRWEYPANDQALSDIRQSRLISVSQAYRESVKATCGGIDLLGMRVRHGQGVRLNNIYVPITTSATSDNKVLEGNYPQERNVLDLLNEHSLCLIGTPGSGKSTFCRWVAWLAAEGGMPQSDADEASAVMEDYPIVLCGRLPVYVPLRDFWSWLPDNPCGSELSASAMLNALVYWLEQKNIGGLSIDAIQAYLGEGRAMLIFDGIDEVPLSVSKAGMVWEPRSLLISGLRAACPAWAKSGNRILLSSRPYGMDPLQVPEPLSVITLDGLCEASRSLLIQRWFRILAENHDAGDRAAADLERHIGENVWLGPLTRNPLLLTALCIIFDEGKRLPQDRHDLYDRIVDTVLHSRYRDPIAKDRARNCLCVIAHGMHTGAEGLDMPRDTPQATATYHEIERIITTYQQGIAWMEKDYLTGIAMREDLLSRSGLFAPQGDKTASFSHLSFQEYLAAQRILETHSDLSQIFVERSQRPEWHNTLSLLFGRVLGVWVDPARAIKLTERLLDVVKQEPDNVKLMGVIANCVEILWRKGKRLREEREHEIRNICTDIISSAAPDRIRTRLGDTLALIGDSRPAVVSIAEMEFCLVPAGSFTMGSDAADPDAHQDETNPELDTCMEYDYWIGRYPISNAQFNEFLQDDGYANDLYWEEALQVGVWRDGQIADAVRTHVRNAPVDFGLPANLANHPVIGITWYEALAFTRWLEGLPLFQDWMVSLPNEPEWEKAARGGRKILSEPCLCKPEILSTAQMWREVDNPRPRRSFPWGEKPGVGCANHDSICLGTTNALGCYPDGASVYGCEEMSGNVWEWTRSISGDYPYPVKNKPLKRREDLASQKKRVLRGGAFNTDVGGIRCTYRHYAPPTTVADNIGFRIVLSRPAPCDADTD